MRHFLIIIPILAVFLVGLVATQRLGIEAVAQEDASVTAQHPLVGAWLVDLGEEGGRLLTFSADGTVLFTDVDGTTGQGTWEATSDTAAAFTTYQPSAEQLEEGPNFTGYFVIAGEVDVDAAGHGTIDLVLAQTDFDGVVHGVEGPFTVTAMRIPVVPSNQVTGGMPIPGSPSAATPAP